MSPTWYRAILLEGPADTVDPSTFARPPDERLEAVHLYDVTDMSLHLCLPRERSKRRVPQDGARRTSSRIMQPRSWCSGRATTLS